MKQAIANKSGVANGCKVWRDGTATPWRPHLFYNVRHIQARIPGLARQQLLVLRFPGGIAARDVILLKAIRQNKEGTADMGWRQRLGQG